MRKTEQKVTGVAACLKLLELRFEDVVRMYVTESTLPRFKHFLKKLAEAKKAYHVVSEDDLKKVTDGSIHHEGVCVLARRAEGTTLQDVLSKLPASGPVVLLYLEDVANPHNVGAITRVAAHFGAGAVLVDAAGESLAAVSSAAMHRTAEGGAEVVPVIPVEERRESLAALKKAGFTFLASSSHSNRSLFGSPLPARCVLLLGSESKGLSPTLEKQATLSLNIPGTGAVESLNVACAASALLSEFYRQHFWSLKPST